MSIVLHAMATAAMMASASDTTSAYPELPVARNYVRIAKLSVDAWNKKFRLPPDGKAAALAFVFHREPVKTFEDLSVSDMPTLRKGHIDPSFRKTWEYRRDYDTARDVSGQMAMLIVRDALYVYERKILKPTSKTQPLFAANPGQEMKVRLLALSAKQACKNLGVTLAPLLRSSPET